MNHTTIPLKDLRRAAYNPRIMPSNEAEALQLSIKTFGFVEPVVVNEHACNLCGDRKNILIGGHQRLTALEMLIKTATAVPNLAMADDGTEIPATVVDLHLAQEKQLNIALNKLGGSFDTVKLKYLMREIMEMHTTVDMAATGFTAAERDNLLQPIELNEAAAFAKVPDGDEPATPQMSFVLSNDQKVTLYEAIAKAREEKEIGLDMDNEITMGHAVVELAKTYLQKHGSR